MRFPAYAFGFVLASGLFLSTGLGEPTAAAGRSLLAGPQGEPPDERVLWVGPVEASMGKGDNDPPHLILEGTGSVALQRRAKIDPEKTYRVEGVFRSARAEQISRVLLDVRFLTKEGEYITPMMVQPSSRVGRALKTAPAGADTLEIDAEEWPEALPVRTALALGAKEDESDLPNFEICKIAAYSLEGTVCKVKLAEPLEHPLEAGSGVRLHRYRDYPRAYTNELPTEWTTLSFRIGPGEKLRIWPGAAYAEIRVLHHYNRYPEPLPQSATPPRLLFHGIALRMVDR